MKASRAILATLAAATFALVVHALPASVAASLQFDRTAIAAGQWWRILTCHFTHWSANHFAWDWTVFCALGVACEVASRRRLLVTLLVSAVTIPVALLMLQPQFQTYRGLSGLDSALFALLAVDLLWEKVAGRDWRTVGAIALILAAFIVKTVIEAVTGAAVFADSAAGGFVPVPLAHLVGAAVGAIVPIAAAAARGGRFGRHPHPTPLRWPSL